MTAARSGPRFSARGTTQPKRSTATPIESATLTVNATGSTRPVSALSDSFPSRWSTAIAAEARRTLASPIQVSRETRRSAADCATGQRYSATMEAYRTPDERFDELPGYAYAPRYLEQDGLRMHYVDEGPVIPSSSCTESRRGRISTGR